MIPRYSKTPRRTLWGSDDLLLRWAPPVLSLSRSVRNRLGKVVLIMAGGAALDGIE